MNKIIAAVLGLGALTVASATSIRTPITFVDVFDPSPDIKMCGCSIQSYSFVHDIRDNGFDTWSNFILNSSLVLTLVDDVDVSSETVRIKFDDIVQQENMEVDAGPYSFIVQSAFLQTDGKLKVSLRAKSGDFWFRKSELTVNAEAIPEPTTFAMLGLGLLGLGLVSRRKKK
jgi:hypothetical protein